MQSTRTIVTGCCLLILSSLLPCSPAFAQEGYPAIAFDYGFVPFDRACSKLTDFEIKAEWIEELESRMESFQQIWEERGPRLLEFTVNETGLPFRQRDMRATMTLCRFTSMSHPLLLNMRPFLTTATDNEPREMHMFVALVFHELLHTYVFDNRGDSALLEKYEAEPFSVKSHIHLMALLKNAYLALGYEEELRDIMELDRQIGPIYSRSWEIVNELEDYKAFVDELKNWKGPSQVGVEGTAYTDPGVEN